VWLFGPGFNRGQAIQQERVGHVMGVLRRWSVHRDLAACQMNGEGVSGENWLSWELALRCQGDSVRLRE
jgi:hypothetical protein